MDFLEIPPDLTCTQAGQKWHVPSGAKSIPPKAFKFDDLTFEKIEENKKRKRSLVGESRESYCATPQFALQTSSEELQSLVERLRFAGKASLFCEAVESNQCQPCSFFQTSSGKVIDRIAASNVEQQRGEEQCLYIHALYEHVPTYKHGDCLVDSVTGQKINDKVGLSIDRSIKVCLQTVNQSTEPSLCLEHSNRLTAVVCV